MEVDADPSTFCLASFNHFKEYIGCSSNFSEEDKLGEGSFGPVYKGYLPKDEEVAIKRLSKKSVQGLEELVNELKLSAKLQQTNLLGCWIAVLKMRKRYSFMSICPIKPRLYSQANLDWGKRFLIIEGIAQGLLLLHKYSRLRITHKDLKASNILLNHAMTPKISDFGMARIFDQTEANTKRVCIGYMSPECALHRKFSDVVIMLSNGSALIPSAKEPALSIRKSSTTTAPSCQTSSSSSYNEINQHSTTTTVSSVSSQGVG
ncbi:LOW QUALITY PROTEIN: hypothetical protein RJ640_011222 [Escallonia rubra]|uniref:non-specific serine/threonine protein kinase n=1 Tax=Escallonia rubra TaxID=112253 RepID=A0AA88UK03_9ASTE|nr:LOW QUALITY PROTEIN: hypothetical protein RJ640_011222 [Escallonia rubra]